MLCFCAVSPSRTQRPAVVSCSGGCGKKSEGSQPRSDPCLLSLTGQQHSQESEQVAACLIQSIFDFHYTPLSLICCEVRGGLCADLAVSDGPSAVFSLHLSWQLEKDHIHSKVPQTMGNLLYDFKRQMT